MHMKHKKGIAILLTLAMLFSILPAGAVWATETTDSTAAQSDIVLMNVENDSTSESFIDATTTTPGELNFALTEVLETGATDITITLKPDAEPEMITAIHRAICDTEGVSDGSIHLTLKGITTIGYQAFYGCSSLASINIPASVIKIDDYAFEDCSGLDCINYLGTLEPILATNVLPSGWNGTICVPEDYIDATFAGETVIKHSHSSNDDICFYNGICSCGYYQPADSNIDGYYEIDNAGKLFWFAQQVNTVNEMASAVLTANIDLESKPWTPIGVMGEANNCFRGIFDGQNYTIRGLCVEGSQKGVGFFGEVRTGTVKNFTIYGEVKVNTEVDYVGGVIGSICGVNGTTNLERNGAIIQNITSYVNVTANAHGVGMIGGFVGHADHQSLIEQCAWYGTFDAGKYRVDSGAGGFIGKIQENKTSEVTIRNCGAYGTIKTNYAGDYNNTATIYMGGFLGLSDTGARTTLENNLFAGKFERGANLTNQAHLGAFGTLRGVNAIKNCYYLGDDGLAAVHSDSTLNPESDNVEITKVTDEELKGGTTATRLGERWEQGENYPVLKKDGHTHKYTYTNKGDGTHTVECVTGKGEGVYDEKHTITYSATDNVITKGCAKCAYETGTATITAQDAIYDGTAKTATVTYSGDLAGSELTPVYKAMSGSALTEEKAINAGYYRASITIDDTTARVNFTISPAELFISGATVADKLYDGTTSATVSEIVFSGFMDSDTLIKGTDYTVTAAFADASAGENKDVTVTVTLQNTGATKNYTLINNTYIARANITKADSVVTPSVESANITATYGDTITITATVGPKEVATFANTVNDVAENSVAFYYGDTLLGTVDNVPVTGGEVTFTYDTKENKVPTGTHTITAQYGGSVKLNGSNSDAINVTLYKAVPAYIVPTGLTATYGQTLATVALPDGFTWQDATQAVNAAGTFKAVFTPADTENYQMVTDIDIIVTHAHTHAAEWSNDDINHWHACPCGDKADIAGHIYDNDADTTCICGYTRTVDSGGNDGSEGSGSISPGYSGGYIPSTPSVSDKVEITVPDTVGDAMNVEAETITTSTLNDVKDVAADDETLSVIGGKGSAVQIVAKENGKAVERFTQSVSVTVPVSKADIKNVTDTGKLTLAMVTTDENGDTQLTYVGGKYDADKGTFSAYTDKPGNYVLVEKDDLTKIELTIDHPVADVNGRPVVKDVPSRIVDERTLVPARFILQHMGCGIDWNGDTRTVIVTLPDGRVLTMPVDEPIPGFGAAPMIEDGRTLVPVAYIAYAMEAQVLRVEDERKVVIVK